MGSINDRLAFLCLPWWTRFGRWLRGQAETGVDLDAPDDEWLGDLYDQRIIDIEAEEEEDGEPPSLRVMLGMDE